MNSLSDIDIRNTMMNLKKIAQIGGIFEYLI